MAKAEQIKALINSHLKRDDEQFVSIALQLAANEARNGHTVLAGEIRALIDDKKNRPLAVVSISDDLSDLVQESEPQTDVTSLVVSDALQARISRITKEFCQAEKLAKHGLTNRRKILLSGPPGTGKTMTAAALAKQTGLPFFTVQFDRLVTRYLGETGAKLRQIFAMIRKRPGVYLFDEFDAIGAQRGLESDVGEMRRVLNALLQFIETDDSNSVIVAATNSPGSLDSALFRRFDDILSYEKPSHSETVYLLTNRLGSFLGQLSLDDPAQIADGLSHAEIAQACDDAIKEAVLSDRSKIAQKSLVQMLKDKKHTYTIINE